MNAVKHAIVVIVAAIVILALMPGTASAQTVTVTLNQSQTYQTIDGFGVAQPRFGPGHPSDSGIPPIGSGLGTCPPTPYFAGPATGSTPDPAHRLAMWPEPYRSKLMDWAFSDLNGIGLTILRSKITSALELTAPVGGVRAWCNTNDAHQVWIMQQAVARGPVKLLATPWSPPAWMKTNDSTWFGHCVTNLAEPCERDIDPSPNDADGDTGCGAPGMGGSCIVGKLNPSYYQYFAEYLRRYVKEFASANGVSIYAVSMANEPEAQIAWDGTAWYGQWIADFLRFNLTPVFATSPAVSSKVVVPEPGEWRFLASDVPLDPFYTGPNWGTSSHPLAPNTIMGPTISDSAALARVDIVAGHQYGGDPDTSNCPPDCPFPGAIDLKPRWQTEASYEDLWPSPGIPTGFVDVATEVHTSLTGAANVSAWIYFIFFGGDAVGVAPNYNKKTSLVGYSGNDVVRSKSFFALGNFSRFVRPGFLRIQTTSNSSQILASSYKDPAMGQLVIVAINNGTSARTVQFNVGFSTIATPYVTSAALDLEPQDDVPLNGTVSIPARSVVTYVAHPPLRTSDILWRKTDGSTMVWLSGIAATASYPGAKPSNWLTKGIGDFDGNGRGDILWRDQVNGINTFYYNGTAASQGSPGNLPSDWSISGVGDFVGLTRSDILWRNTNGWVAIWQDGTNTTTWLSALGPEWQIQGVGDFVGTSKADILWRCISQAPCGQAPSGSVAIWQDGTTATTWPGARSLDWQIHGVGDFWGDGRSDIFWRQPSTGWTSIWHNGTNYTTTPGLAGSDWPVQAVGDYDGDGKSDILYRHTAGTMHVWLGANPSTALTPENPGALWQVAGAGRFDR